MDLVPDRYQEAIKRAVLLVVTTCNHRRPGPQSSVGICPHSVRLSAGANPQSVRPKPDYSRRTCNRRPRPTFLETVDPCVTSTPWPHVCQMTGKMMHGRKPDADFGTGFRLPVAHSRPLKINRQENGRYPDPPGQRSKILRLTDFGSNAMIAGPSHAMRAGSHRLRVWPRR